MHLALKKFCRYLFFNVSQQVAKKMSVGIPAQLVFNVNNILSTSSVDFLLIYYFIDLMGARNSRNIRCAANTNIKLYYTLVTVSYLISLLCACIRLQFAWTDANKVQNK